MRVRLVKKLADKIDGIDLSGHAVGACLHVDEREAQLLIAEGWAVSAVRKKKPTTDLAPPVPHVGTRPPSKID